MQGQPGFMGFNVISDGESYTVSSRCGLLCMRVHAHVHVLCQLLTVQVKQLKVRHCCDGLRW